MKAPQLIVAFAVGLIAAGCAQSLETHQASLQAVERLRSINIPPLRVGKFSPAPELASQDRSISIRAVNLTSPDHGSFAEYLGGALETDLRAGGKLDGNSKFVIEGLLTDNQVSAGISDGTASLAAKFSVSAEGKNVFEKTLVARSTWDSSFVGAIAIPEAINHYSSLYEELVLKLLTDQDFNSAVALLLRTSFLEPHSPGS